VGDSTADQSIDRLHEGFSGVQGGGVLFPAFFDADRINVVDVARGGRSRRMFQTDGNCILPVNLPASICYVAKSTHTSRKQLIGSQHEHCNKAFPLSLNSDHCL
jgi:hypothetical protein